MSEKYQPMSKNDLDKLVDNEPINMVDGKCSRCGHCCTHHLPIMPSEIDQIKKYIKDNDIKPYHHTVPGKDESVDFQCPFLDASDKVCKCLIHPVRPWICKYYNCEIIHDKEKCKEAFDKMTAADGVNIMEILKNKRDEQNTGQLFFPEEYEPKPMDRVIINELYMTEYKKFENIIFICTDQKRVKNNMTEVLIINPFMKLWFDIRGLTKIETK